MSNRSIAIAVLVAGVLAAVSGAKAVNYLEPEYDEREDVSEEKCRDKLHEYQSEVEKCLMKAADLEEAQACYETDLF
jgi:hypothetical protein